MDDRNPDVERFGTVKRAPAGTQIERGIFAVEWDDSPGDVEFVPEHGLVPVAAPGESVCPGLSLIDSVRLGGDKPSQVVIEGENLHALQTLRYTHAGKVDAIYIEPPYNTGGDLIYNDKYLQREDQFRHSKWLSFMDRRLRIARDLLTDDGVIIVAIDDNEQAHLRLLMDEIFLEKNFIDTIVWQGQTSALSKATSGGIDYMLIYAKNKDKHFAQGAWSDPKVGAQAVLDAAAEAWDKSWGVSEDATKRLRAWWRSIPTTHPAKKDKGLSAYDRIDDDGQVFQGTSMAGSNDTYYDIINPNTGNPVKQPAGGWSMSEETAKQRIRDGQIIFADHDDAVPRFKRLLIDNMSQLPAQSFSLSRSGATKRLEKILGEKRFKFPKDTAVLARWLNIVTFGKKDAVILDFFGGSGSTMQAVMEMNEADGGSRQCVLVTNNEVEAKERKALVKAGRLPGDEEFEARGIFRRVTYPRIKTVATGVREDGSKYSDGMKESVAFFHLDYLSASSTMLGREFDAVAPLMWMKAGATGDVLTGGADDFLVSTDHAVVFDTSTSVVTRLVAALNEAGFKDGADVFVVTDDDDRYARACARLSNFTLHRLYEDYVTNFEVRV